MRLTSFAQFRLSWLDVVQIGLGAVIGLPLAARFVFELTGTPNGGGSMLQSATRSAP